MVTFVPRDGVDVTDPRLRAVHGALYGSDKLAKEKLSLPESDPAALQLLRHVRRGELDPGDAFTAAMAGVPWTTEATQQRRSDARKGDK